MAKKYATKDDVEEFLNREFTPAQASLCDWLLEAATELIDDDYFVNMNPGGALISKFYNPGPHIQVNSPIDEAQPVLVSAKYSIDAAPVALVAGTSFEVRNAKLGEIYLPNLDWDILTNPINRAKYYSVTVSYFTPATVPQKVKLATCIIVSHYLRPSLNDEVFGIQNYTDGELSVSFTTKVMEEGIPAEAERLLKKLGQTLAVR